LVCTALVLLGDLTCQGQTQGYGLGPNPSKATMATSCTTTHAQPLLHAAPLSRFEVDNEIFVVAVGQRVADAVADFALRHELTMSSVSARDDNGNNDVEADLEEIYWAVCAHLRVEHHGVFECVCDSPRPSRLITSLRVADVCHSSAVGIKHHGNRSVHVRAGYSADASAHFYCSQVVSIMDPSACSAAEFEVLSAAVGSALYIAAMDTWMYTPFALLEGRHLLHLLQYRFTELKTNKQMVDICSFFWIECLDINNNLVVSEICEQSYVPSGIYMCEELYHTEEVYGELRRAEYADDYSWTPPTGVHFLLYLVLYLYMYVIIILSLNYSVFAAC
jgi:hypothetical protein